MATLDTSVMPVISGVLLARRYRLDGDDRRKVLTTSIALGAVPDVTDAMKVLVVDRAAKRLRPPVATAAVERPDGHDGVSMNEWWSRLSRKPDAPQAVLDILARAREDTEAVSVRAKEHLAVLEEALATAQEQLDDTKKNAKLAEKLKECLQSISTDGDTPPEAGQTKAAPAKKTTSGAGESSNS